MEYAEQVWGTTKTHQLKPGDQVLVGQRRVNDKTYNYLPSKTYVAKSDPVWKTVESVDIQATSITIYFTDKSSGGGGGTATRYYARKAVVA